MKTMVVEGKEMALVHIHSIENDVPSGFNHAATEIFNIAKTMKNPHFNELEDEDGINYYVLITEGEYFIDYENQIRFEEQCDYLIGEWEKFEEETATDTYIIDIYMNPNTVPNRLKVTTWVFQCTESTIKDIVATLREQIKDRYIEYRACSYGDEPEETHIILDGQIFAKTLFKI